MAPLRACGVVSLFLVGTGLSGCGIFGPDKSFTSTSTTTHVSTSATTSTSPPPSTTTTTASIGVQCDSDLRLSNFTKVSQKGLCIDDTSFFDCPHKLVRTWPHTDETVKYVRLFKAFRPEDDENATNQTRDHFVSFVKSNNIKVLVGSQITCNKTDDERDWKYVQMLVEQLGSKHVLALAVGNELDQLQYILNATTKRSCLDMIWGGYALQQTLARISWVRQTLDSPDLPVTSVLTGGILWMSDLFPNTPDARIMDYYRGIYNSGEKHFVFTFNFYPIFDPTNKLDVDGRCSGAMQLSSCYDGGECKMVKNLVAARQKIDRFVSSDAAWGLTTAPFWIGEVGWSSPMMDQYDGPMKSCPDFFSKQMMLRYYQSFLEWDLTMPGLQGPELAFYFTMRDSSQWGNQESFGLMNSCAEDACKLSMSDLLNESLSVLV